MVVLFESKQTISACAFDWNIMKFYQLLPAEIFFEYKIHKTILTIPFLKPSFNFKYFINCYWDKKNHFNRLCKWIQIVETYHFHIADTCKFNPTLFSIYIANESLLPRCPLPRGLPRRLLPRGGSKTDRLFKGQSYITQKKILYPILSKKFQSTVYLVQLKDIES